MWQASQTAYDGRNAFRAASGAAIDSGAKRRHQACQRPSFVVIASGCGTAPSIAWSRATSPGPMSRSKPRRRTSPALTSPRTFGNYGSGSTLFWVDPALDMTFVFLSAGVMQQAPNIERFQRLSDIAVSAAL